MPHRIAIVQGTQTKWNGKRVQHQTSRKGDCSIENGTVKYIIARRKNGVLWQLENSDCDDTPHTFKAIVIWDDSKTTKVGIHTLKLLD